MLTRWEEVPILMLHFFRILQFLINSLALLWDEKSFQMLLLTNSTLLILKSSKRSLISLCNLFVMKLFIRMLISNLLMLFLEVNAAVLNKSSRLLLLSTLKVRIQLMTIRKINRFFLYWRTFMMESISIRRVPVLILFLLLKCKSSLRISLCPILMLEWMVVLIMFNLRNLWLNKLRQVLRMLARLLICMVVLVYRMMDGSHLFLQYSLFL